MYTRFKIIDPKDNPSLSKIIFYDLLGQLIPFPFIFLIIYYIRSSIHPNKYQEWIQYQDKKLTIKINELKQQFEYTTIQDFKIYYNSDQFIEDSAYLKHSKITFSIEDKTHVYYFKHQYFKTKKLLNFLYKRKIKFKEYKNESRVFKGKKPNYKTIQRLKKQYNIDW